MSKSCALIWRVHFMCSNMSFAVAKVCPTVSRSQNCNSTLLHFKVDTLLDAWGVQEKYNCVTEYNSILEWMACYEIIKEPTQQ